MVSGIAALAWSVAGVSAHEGATPLVVDPPEISPGGTVVLRLGDAGADDPIIFVLEGADGDVEIASGVTDGEGHLALAARIPSDLSPGTFAIIARSGDRNLADATVVVAGPAISEGDDAGGQRGQDEPLAGPLATTARPSAPNIAAATKPAATVAVAAGELSTSAPLEVAPAALALALGVVGVVGVVGAVGLSARSRLGLRRCR